MSSTPLRIDDELELDVLDTVICGILVNVCEDPQDVVPSAHRPVSY